MAAATAAPAAPAVVEETPSGGVLRAKSAPANRWRRARVDPRAVMAADALPATTTDLVQGQWQFPWLHTIPPPLGMYLPPQPGTSQRRSSSEDDKDRRRRVMRYNTNMNFTSFNDRNRNNVKAWLPEFDRVCRHITSQAALADDEYCHNLIAACP